MARILLIEDDASQRFVAAFALKKAGHEVFEAVDGAEGLAAVDQFGPELVVCDVMMPGMTGYEVLGSLRDDVRHATLPFILLTAMADRQHMRQGMVSGADDYLTKPYKPDELCEAVESTLARKQTRHNAFLSTMSDVVDGALEQQKEHLGRQYESRLADEINARWVRKATSGGDLLYPAAVLLLASVPSPAETGSAEALADAVKRSLQSSRDTLYLFGADHVLPYGSDLLAVFAGDESSATTPVELRAVRAAFALAKAAPREQPIAIGLHMGPVNLIAVQDELHGDQGHTVLPGDAIANVAALREFAESARWRVASSPDVPARLGRELATGRAAQTGRGDKAVELTGLTG
jgi:CheY-like chemotaxis protein